MSLRRLLLLPLLTASLFAFGLLGVAQAADESIKNFDSYLTVNKDGTVQVEEDIEYDFGSNQKHGIFRDIPLTAKDGPDIGITVNDVKNENGESYHYVESTNNGVLDIKIGDANRTVTGIKTYKIYYTVTNVIRPFADHDELYWNVTGNDWAVPINSASASITVPGDSKNITTTCFTGEVGSTDKKCDIRGRNQMGDWDFHTQQPLEVGQGLTVVLGFPLGLVDDTVTADVSSGTSPDINFTSGDWAFFLVILLVIIIIIIGIISMIVRLFRKPGYKGPIVVQYQPPEGLSPLEVGALLDKIVDTKDISSVILDLAVRGYLKIRYTVEEIKFWPDKKDFEFTKLKDGSTLSHPGEKILFDLFFAGRDTVTLSALLADKDSFHLEIESIKTATDNYLLDQGYYDQAAKSKADKMITKLAIGLVALIILSFLLSLVTSGFGLMFVFPGVLYIIFRMGGVSGLAKTFTPKGQKAQADVAGFKEFLQLTEKDKLELLNAPKLKPETFEKFLPYAMALGVEGQWAKKFEGLYNATPKWYDDPTHQVFSSTVLISNLQQFNGAFNRAVISSAPQSSSGFSGGSSGGGSGGGGGGSW